MPLERQDSVPCRIAVVTGCSRGLGAALSLHLSDQGFVVVRAQRTIGQQPEKPLHSSGNTRDFCVDLASKRSVQEFCDQLVDELPFIDLLVNNAAICPPEPPYGEDLSAHWDDVMRTNFAAHVQITESLLPLLLRSCHCPRVVNISSGDGELLYFSEPLRSQIGRLYMSETADVLVRNVDAVAAKVQALLSRDRPHEVVYGEQRAYKLSKAALNAYTRFAAARNDRVTESRGISFVSVCPGDFVSDMADDIPNLLSPTEAVERLGPLLDPDIPCKSGIFLRYCHEIPW